MTEIIYCAGGSPDFAHLAVKHGLGYGSRLPETVYHPLDFADQNWKNPDRTRYMQELAKYKPRMATVLDLERPDQFDEVMSWAEEASQHVQEAVIIIPKIDIIASLPRSINGKEVRLGFSVPTRYGATLIPFSSFAGRGVHLLGGSPVNQRRLSGYFQDVRSIDNNYIKSIAKYGAFFSCSAPYGRTMREETGENMETGAPFRAFEMSCMNLKALWLGCIAGIRYAAVSDVPKIMELSKLVLASDLSAAARQDRLVVAFVGTRIVGYLLFRIEPDNWSTVLDLQVHPDFRRNRIGSALLQSLTENVRIYLPYSEALQRFAEFNGFREIKRGFMAIWEKPIPEAVLHRRTLVRVRRPPRPRRKPLLASE
jgi:GNAT superfamily N-acetyltransferase